MQIYNSFPIDPRGTHLWEFIRDILLNPERNPGLIKWEDRTEGVFRFLKSEAVAQLWGKKKNNSSMTYEKLSRAMRYEYSRTDIVNVLTLIQTSCLHTIIEEAHTHIHKKKNTNINSPSLLIGHWAFGSTGEMKHFISSGNCRWCFLFSAANAFTDASSQSPLSFHLEIRLLRQP